jgi:DNA modification methylase
MAKKNENTQDTLFDNTIKVSDYSEVHSVTEKYRSILSEKLNDIKEVSGAPIGKSEDIINNSLPPYFTFSPNPFISELNKIKSIDNKRDIKPLTQDISAGKNDPIYFAHYYSTKVPPQAIVPYILHYTDPGDTVLDGFCGTGMTGIASQICASSMSKDKQYGEIGLRNTILIDLSPAATFIAAGTNMVGELKKYLPEISYVLDEIDKGQHSILHTRHIGWLRGTVDLNKRINLKITSNTPHGTIEYVVWSDVFACYNCDTNIVYWDLVFKGPKKEIKSKNPCPNCDVPLSINNLNRAYTYYFDYMLGKAIKLAKQVPVLINYKYGSKRYEKFPDDEDINLIEEINNIKELNNVPVVELPIGYNTQQPKKSHGFTHIHHFFTKRNLILMSEYLRIINNYSNPMLRFAGMYLLTGAIQRICKLNRYMPNHDRHVGPLSGTLYVAPITVEIPATRYISSRIKDIKRCQSFIKGNGINISTQSATDLRNINSESVDYIFTDPPFGGNLNYSELNILIEAWLKVYTNNESEAIINEYQNKNINAYKILMEDSFKEYYRVLKSGKWMTVEFHNSQNSIWITIQESLISAGFVIADVRTLNKQKGTTKQLSYSNAVKQDLIITAYKPNDGLEKRFRLSAGTGDSVWDFIRTHLKQLPIFVSKDGEVEIVSERQNYLLYDRMVAFHVQRGVSVPISAGDFYKGLSQRFPERDNMYFLPEQVAEYDKKRMSVNKVLQLQLFVNDEASAIIWLKQQLSNKPQSFQDIHPVFMRELGGWQKHEKPLELSDLLSENFLRYDGQGEIPSQIHSYLSSNYKELRNLQKDDSALKAKAKDRWYVPDPNKAGDLEKLRERSLLKEFEEYKESQQRKLKVFRLEAVRAGFKKAWQEKDYKTIIDVAKKIPDNVLQEDSKLLMWYDQAVTRSGEDR